MANLSFSEKQLIESVFGMSGGYFLNFSNRDFEEFMRDVMGYSVYTKYPGLSKAKIFREFYKDETDSYVGKAIVMAINHMRENSLITDDLKERTDNLYKFGVKLLGKANTQFKSKESTSEVENESLIDYDSLNQSLLEIEKISSPQAKGYAFEKYLNSLFKAFDLAPHASYRTEYDQIDGSFVLDGNTILVEAKYRTNAIPKDDLLLFSRKIESKSHFPKGLFITYSPVDAKAIEYFTDRSARIIILTVQELFLICQNKHSLPKVLQAKFRILDVRGIIFKHIMEINL
jgi:hypothetical protein